MSQTLIIHASRHAGLPRRVFSFLATLAMWGVWCGLWMPVIRTYNYLVSCCGSYELAAIRLINGIPAVAVEHAMAAILGTATTLVLWSVLPGRKSPRFHRRNSLDDYARHFDLKPSEILAGRMAPVCTVHHDESGRIVRIETRDSSGQS